jgi:polyisoprenoid-binding protein YceI
MTASMGEVIDRAPYGNLFSRTLLVAFLVFCAAAVVPARAQDTTLQVDPSHTSVQFTLGDVLHTVRGTFKLKRGALQLDTASGKISGEIVVDARSGESGSSMRDRKMHKEILESDRYPEISFQVHGIFSIHGVDLEITVPAEVEMSPDHWSATIHFTVPYEKWGMKNPSTLFLRVNDFVEIDVAAAGNIGKR